jgi:dethiobiotin synthetase
MNLPIVVSGTDTGIGKTVFSAGLVGLLDGTYWKCVQAGIGEETDSDVVRRLAGVPPDRVLSEAYRLSAPLSPHRAAEIDNVKIDVGNLSPPVSDRPLVVEGAGGLLVPLDRRTLLVDVFARWGAPVVLCARTRLGTINHTLLSIEALRSRSVPILGIAFIGDEMADTQQTICAFAKTRMLGRLPRLDPLTSQSLAVAMRASFDPGAFRDSVP